MKFLIFSSKPKEAIPEEPLIDIECPPKSSKRHTKKDDLKYNQWLQKVALQTARQRNDEWSQFLFGKALNPANMHQSDYEGISLYVWNEIDHKFTYGRTK